MTDAAPASAPAEDSLLARYRRQLLERGFDSDPAQLAALARLDDLRGRLIAEDRPVAIARWLTRLLPLRPVAPLTGLYLWGGVGRGKTWLMDLFFASLPFPERRRVHFHRFMHDVHAQLAALKQQSSPLEQVAEAIAQDTRVLCFDELFVADIGDAMILGGLFAGLFRRGVTLVATSNVPPRDLYRDGLQRQRFVPAIELLEQHMEVIDFPGSTDYRLRQLATGEHLLDAGRAGHSRAALKRCSLNWPRMAHSGAVPYRSRAGQSASCASPTAPYGSSLLPFAVDHAVRTITSRSRANTSQSSYRAFRFWTPTTRMRRVGSLRLSTSSTTAAST